MTLSQRQVFELCDLFAALHDGALSDAEVRAAEGLLREDRDVRRLYVRYMRVCAGLAWDLGSGGPHEEPSHQQAADSVAGAAVDRAASPDAPLLPPAPHGCDLSNAAPPTAPMEGGPVLGFLSDVFHQGCGLLSDHTLLFSIIGVLVVAGATALVMMARGKGRQAAEPASIARDSGMETKSPGPQPSTSNHSSSVARLVATYGAIWREVDEFRNTGPVIVAGQRLELDSGLAEIVFASGAKLMLEGPAELRIQSANSAFLFGGRLSVRADTAESHGFTLHTKMASVVDLGTEFHVQTASDGHSQIDVTAGAVEIQTAHGRSKRRLEMGQTAQVEPGEAGIIAVIEGGDETPAFRFPTIEPPSNKDYADASQHHATISLVEGRLSPDSGPVELLLDGRGQSKPDSPAESVFVAGRETGKFLVDLGKAVRVQKINTYSWHEGVGKPRPPNGRYTGKAPQRYTLYGFSADNPPPVQGEPAEHGWTRICHVDTDEFFSVPPILNRPAQQAVTISGANGEVGRYRYLLWVAVPTRVQQFAGSTTFFGEFDVYAEEIKDKSIKDKVNDKDGGIATPNSREEEKVK
jgi:hypothetical protein